MKILIVGCGSIARRHIKNLKSIRSDIQIAVWRQFSRNSDLGDVTQMVEQVVFDLEAVEHWKPDAALITNPASMHVDTALKLAEQGIDLFIEKPISDSLEGLDRLQDLSKKNNLVCMVGYNMRFYQPLRTIRETIVSGNIGRLMTLRAEVGQYLPDWRKIKDYRKSVSARKNLGGGVVLELSHELDYARWLMGEVKEVIGSIGRLSDLDIDVEDTADIILKFANGATGSIHLDMTQRPTRRISHIVGTEGSIMWDIVDRRLQVFSNATNSWSNLHSETQHDPNDMYISEMRHFIDCVEGKNSPLIGVDEGRRVLEIALAVKESSSMKRAVEL